jgi:hypothetical protein
VIGPSRETPGPEVEAGVRVRGIRTARHLSAPNVARHIALVLTFAESERTN